METTEMTTPLNAVPESVQPKVKRAVFTSKIGTIAATVGSAVGLGNIWRFPYEAGTHGGGAFLITYLAFVLLFGVPLMCAEFVIGRGTRSDVYGAFHKLAPKSKWYLIGYLSLTASTMILGFYCVVAGWTLEYFIQSFAGGLDFPSQEGYHNYFQEFCTGNFRPVVWTLAFVLLNYFILARGVTKGIEKMSNIMMPILFLILIAFSIYAFTMSGFSEGAAFFFKPDFSKLTSSTILGALGQTFFSLSLAMGCMIVYGSYFPEKQRLGSTAVTTASLGSVVAIFAGIIIFPAVFTYGFTPQAGPALIFEVLPSVFNQMPGGVIWSILFFFLLIIASLSSTISLSEISIAYFTEQKKMSRKKATTINHLMFGVLAVLCALSFGCLRDFKIFDKGIFDLLDYVSSNIILPIGGIAISIFTGWVLKKSYLRDQFTDGGKYKFRMLNVFIFIYRYVAPGAIFLIFLHSIGLI